MYIRGVMSALATNSTSTYLKQKTPTGGTGNVFVGGDGAIGIANTTDDFMCAGGTSSMFLANRGSDCQIQSGTGSASIGMDPTYDTDGKTVKSYGYYTSNNIISVGTNNKIAGTDGVDTIFSLGVNNKITLGGGNDKMFVSGEGSTVDGEDGDDVIMGTPAGLSYGDLADMDITSMLAAIKKAAVKYISTSTNNTVAESLYTSA